MQHFARRYMGLSGVLALLLGTIPAAAAQAQLSRLDQNKLIEALTEEHMGELLVHLAQREARDPAAVQQIIVSQLLVTADNPARDFAARLAALRQALDAQRKLIKDFKDNPQRPVWQTRLVEMLLGNYLTLAGPAAAEFYSFGVPNAQQKEAFESVAGEALEQAIDAEFAIARLRDTLPFDKDYNTKYRGEFSDRLFKEFGERRTRYRAAQACFYAALLPDNHPYYQNLGKTKLVPLQAARPADEKKRLLTLASSRLDELIKDPNITPEAKALFQCLQARVQSARGNASTAVKLLDQVTAANKSDLNDLTARLAKLVALSQQNDAAGLKRELAGLTSHEEMRRMPFYRILAMDVAHRLAMQRAEALPAAERAKAIEEAFLPYSDLINDPGLPAAERQALKEFIDSRWQSLYADRKDYTGLPPFVLLGLGSGLVDQALGQLEEARAEGVAAAQADKLRQDAHDKFQRAITLFNTVLKQTDVTPRARAEATYSFGVATISLDENDLANVFKITDTWSDLAQKDYAPDGPPVAVQKCLEGAVGVLHRLLSRDNPPEEARARYEKAARLLLDKYPQSDAAQSERADFATAVLMRDGKLQEAIDQFSKVSPRHGLYYKSRVLTLTCLRRLAEQADDARRTAGYDKLVQEARRLSADARKELDGGIADETRAAEARYAWGQSRLAVVDVFLERNQPQNALPELENWETDFAKDRALLAEGLGKRIVAFYAATQADKGLAAAQAMVEHFPQEAPQVIKGVLDNLDIRLDRLKQFILNTPDPDNKKALEKQRLDLAAAAQPIAELLIKYGQEHKFSKVQMFPYQISLARSYRLAGKNEESLKLLQGLEKDEELKNDQDLIHGLGESLYAVAMPPVGVKPDKAQTAMLREAERRFATLIINLKKDPETNQYPHLYWNAWMRTLEIYERLGSTIDGLDANKIMISRVKSLQGIDRNLGGEPYKTELERILLAYQLH